MMIKNMKRNKKKKEEEEAEAILRRRKNNNKEKKKERRQSAAGASTASTSVSRLALDGLARNIIARRMRQMYSHIASGFGFGL